MIHYYDRQGRPIDMWECERLLEDDTYRVLARTEVCPGVWVSTIWLGLDRNWFGPGPPIIFETMVFVDLDEPEGIFDREGTETYRYSTEAEAIAHHDQLVAELRAQVGAS